MGFDKDNDEITTLVVDDVRKAEAVNRGAAPKSVPRLRRLLMDVVCNALKEFGEDIEPSATGGRPVRAVAERYVRDRYFARVAEKAEPDEPPGQLYDKQRAGFKRSLKAVIDAQTVVAVDYNGERYIWLP